MKKSKMISIFGGILVFMTIMTGFGSLNLYVIIEGGGGSPPPTTTYYYAPYTENFFDFDQVYYGGSTTETIILYNGYMNKDTGKSSIVGTMLPVAGSYFYSGFTCSGSLSKNINLLSGKTYSLSTQVGLIGIIEAWGMVDAIENPPIDDCGFEFDLNFRLYFKLFYHKYGYTETFSRTVIMVRDDLVHPIPGIGTLDWNDHSGDTAEVNTFKYRINNNFYPIITHTPVSSEYGWRLEVSIYIDAEIRPSEVIPKANLVEGRFLLPGNTQGDLPDSNFKVYYFKIVG